MESTLCDRSPVVTPKLVFEEILGTKARCKILKFLIQVPGMEAHISAIGVKTGLNHITVVKDLDFLVAIGFIQKKEFGRIKIYRFRDENVKAAAVKELIKFWETSL